MRGLRGLVLGSTVGVMSFGAAAHWPYGVVLALVPIVLTWVLVSVVALAAVFSSPARCRAARAVLQLLLASHAPQPPASRRGRKDRRRSRRQVACRSAPTVHGADRRRSAARAPPRAAPIGARTARPAGWSAEAYAPGSQFKAIYLVNSNHDPLRGRQYISGFELQNCGGVDFVDE